MKGYLIVLPDAVRILARAESAGAGGPRGDMVRDVRPGESAFGWTYAELRERGAGELELPKPAAGQPGRE